MSIATGPGQQPPANEQDNMAAQGAAQLAATLRMECAAARKETTETLTKEHALKRKRLQEEFIAEKAQIHKRHRAEMDELTAEKAQIHKRHRAEMDEVKDMAMRQQSISKQLAYIVRGCEAPGLAGSIPVRSLKPSPTLC